MTMTKARMLALFAGVTLMGAMSAPAFAQATPATPAQPAAKEKSKQDKKEKREKQDKQAAKIGQPAPAFTLTDTDGNTVKLEDYKGKIVVLEWFNPDCPIVVMHYKNDTMAKTHAQLKEHDVVWLAINSGAAGKQGAGVERNTEARTEWKMAHPVLIDEAGTVGRSYGAKTTPHMYVIDREGNLAYNGAIDDGSPRGVGKTNYVAQAVNQIAKGETVSTTETKPYGCSVKYGSGS